MTDNKDEISFEEALKNLEKIVDELNNGDMELEKDITAYEKCIKIKKRKKSKRCLILFLKNMIA